MNKISINQLHYLIFTFYKKKTIKLNNYFILLFNKIE